MEGFLENRGEGYWFYDLLKRHAFNLFGEKTSNLSQENPLIADCGMAVMAYARAQFENMDQAERTNIKNALLKYCELDTLAIVMILRAWMDWA